MAPDIIDLISSSPPLIAHDTPPPPRPHQQRAANTLASTSHASIEITSSWISDEIDHEDFDDLDIIINRGTKRRCTASPQHDAPSPPTLPPSTAGHHLSNSRQPPLLNTNNNRITRTIAETIDFTSSPNPIITNREDGAIEAPTAASVRRPLASKSINILSSDFDPFVSSPNKESVLESDPGPKAASLSDPFASSPRNTITENRAKEARASTYKTQEFSKAPPRSNVSPNRRFNLDFISSSAPEPTSSHFPSEPKTAKATSLALSVIEIDDSDSDVGSSGDENDDLPDIVDINLAKYRPRSRSPLKRSRSDIVSSKSRSKPSSAAPKKSTQQRERERTEKAVAKAADKEKKRREREQNKEAKARDKQREAALAEVNKLRTDKKVSTPEMLVDLPSSICPELKVQLETLLEALDVQYAIYQGPVENAFKWRRKVKSSFNEDMARWEPMPLRIDHEHHVLVVLTADEFVALVLADGLDSHASTVKANFDGHEVIYLLQGITPWMKKNRNIRNRQFTSGVRSQEPQTETHSSSGRGNGRRRNNASSQEYVDEEVVEDAMLRLQVEHDVLIHHTTVTLETAQWITAFTQHISTIPYKKQREQATSVAGFCMESGQVRTGDDSKDTYVRMLQEIVRVTAPIAYGVAAEFDTVTKLVDGLKAGGPGRLDAVHKSANKDGAFSDRTIGQAVSRRMYKVFTGKDESGTDV